MLYRSLLYSFLALPVISVAGTTVYTDSAHLPVNPPLMYRLCCSTGHSNCRMLSARCRLTLKPLRWPFVSTCSLLNGSLHRLTLQNVTAVTHARSLGLKNIRRWCSMTGKWCTAPPMWHRLNDSGVREGSHDGSANTTLCRCSAAVYGDRLCG